VLHYCSSRGGIDATCKVECHSYYQTLCSYCTLSFGYALRDTSCQLLPVGTRQQQRPRRIACCTSPARRHLLKLDSTWRNLLRFWKLFDGLQGSFGLTISLMWQFHTLRQSEPGSPFAEGQRKNSKISHTRGVVHAKQQPRAKPWDSPQIGTWEKGEEESKRHGRRREEESEDGQGAGMSGP